MFAKILRKILKVSTNKRTNNKHILYFAKMSESSLVFHNLNFAFYLPPNRICFSHFAKDCLWCLGKVKDEEGYIGFLFVISIPSIPRQKSSHGV